MQCRTITESNDRRAPEIYSVSELLGVTLVESQNTAAEVTSTAKNGTGDGEGE